MAQERRPGSRDGTKIAMTAPVAQERTPEGWTVAFVMPSEHTPKSLPKPDDPPSTPWFLRRNEVLVPLAEVRTAAAPRGPSPRGPASIPAPRPRPSGRTCPRGGPRSARR